MLFVREMLTATFMISNQIELDQAVVLALFLLLIISSGGNSGSQSSMLVIRALTLRERASFAARATAGNRPEIRPQE